MVKFTAFSTSALAEAIAAEDKTVDKELFGSGSPCLGLKNCRISEHISTQAEAYTSRKYWTTADYHAVETRAVSIFHTVKIHTSNFSYLENIHLIYFHTCAEV